MSRRGRSHYVSHIQQSQRVTGAPKRAYLKGLYPEFFARERMMEREEKLRWVHKIGRATGLDPLTGQKYREAKQDKPWYPKSGAAKTKKGRAAQETKVGFGQRRRQKFEGDEGAGPPPPDLAVRGDVPRVKVEEQFSPSELAMMRPPAAMSAEQQAAYTESLQAQRRTAVPTVDPSKEAPDVVAALDVDVDEPRRKRRKPTPC